MTDILKKLQMSDMDYANMPFSAACQMRKDAEKLIRELKSYEQDALRYRWLRNSATSFEQVGRFTPYCIKGQTMQVLEGNELDSLMDRAMEPMV